MSRILALDYGAARCGCAVSDPSGTLATPLPVVEQPGTRKGLGRVAEVVAEYGVEEVVVGLPLTLRGEEGTQAEETRDWAGRLERRLQGTKVHLYDERLTTRQAERTGGSAAEDSRAAAHLLEAFLDSRRATA